MAQFIAAHPNNYMVGRNGQKIKYIITHSIVGSASSAIDTFRNPNRKASAHYIVAWNGTVTKMVKAKNTAYHAGKWSINLKSIGIEHDDRGKPYCKRPESLYKASALLVYTLCKRYKIPISRKYIRQHKEISATACPAGLSINRIVKDAMTIQGLLRDKAKLKKSIAGLQRDKKILKDRITKHKKQIANLQVEKTAANTHAAKTNQELKTCFKDLKIAQTPAEIHDKPQIPRVTKYDNWFVRQWKKLLQAISK